MYYYWWLIILFLYLGILLLYVILTYIIRSGEKKSVEADTVFFAIASIVTLSVVPLVKSNLYGED